LPKMTKRNPETDLSVFLQQSPHLLNLFVTLVYADLTKLS
jgi:hypothetical protein